MILFGDLAFYLGKQFLRNCAIILFVVMSIIFLVDFTELLSQSADLPDLSILSILQMTLLRLPNLVQKLLPFIALFGGMLTFFRLTRSHELTVVRAAGVSVWQFLLPPLFIALCVGIISVTLFNPISAAMHASFTQLETKYLNKRSNLLKLSSEELWLRQVDNNRLAVIHARGAQNQGIDLSDVIIFRYKGEDKFVSRIDAERAILHKGYWELKNALITAPNEASAFYDSFNLDTTLTVNQIQESFASPKTMSFWDLPDFIDTLEKAGFTALKHRLYYHSLLASPALLVAMVLVAATFSLRATRQGGTILLVMGGIFVGFAFYFFSDIVKALGLSGGLSVQVAAWTPALAISLLGMAMMFHLEDG